MIRLCLFDLDQTLVDTDDIEELRLAGASRRDPAYEDEIRRAIRRRLRTIIGEDVIAELRRRVPDLKLGIFTRSPRRYVDVMLAEAYPNTTWDVVVAYEDVDQGSCKPNGQGIHRAMTSVGLGHTSQLPHVLVVGDSDVDLRAAYHAGCRVALFKKGWPQRYQSTHWRCMDLVPDAVIEEPEDIPGCIAQLGTLLPDLECQQDGAPAPRSPRFDDIGKFLPNERTRHRVYVAGRYFPDYDNLNYRRGWHALNQSIYDHKDATTFAGPWIETIRRFIASHYRLLTAMPDFGGGGAELVITAVPARPGRVHRLAHLIQQLRDSYGDTPQLNRLRLTFNPDVLAYRDGVQSQSHDHLNKDQRMANVRDHLFVRAPDAVAGKKFLVIDDVSTTGATLLYAMKYLLEAQARSVDCFSIAQTISDPLRH